MSVSTSHGTKNRRIDDLVDTFNKFERIHIAYENQELIVE
jgi:hypothetical protein